ncbi:DUF6473 family protein [Gymnodinialimonas hymeniacidonis]|uniref:DUF6473 family protein n=1 Tax=Gymnodinialimonas hymeniacidonis TaxID=3126508 RepID=UPI0034C6B56D
MSIEQRGRMPLDYNPVVLPGSALRFRGPLATDRQPSIVCIGGSETFGRFIDAPFPAQLNEHSDQPVINLGVMNAGLDVLMTDHAILGALDDAEAVILQIISAHNMSNRFYTVHPRRNDRFLKASTMLRTIYPQVDFTEFNFTRHMLTQLHELSPDRFEIVRNELEAAWTARMIRFLGQVSAPVHLLWLSNRSPDAEESGDMSTDPLFVSPKMLDSVARYANSLTVVTPDAVQAPDDLQGKFFGPKEEAAARLLPGPKLHALATEELLRKL